MKSQIASHRSEIDVDIEHVNLVDIFLGSVSLYKCRIASATTCVCTVLANQSIPLWIRSAAQEATPLAWPRLASFPGELCCLSQHPELRLIHFDHTQPCTVARGVT